MSVQAKHLKEFLSAHPAVKTGNGADDETIATAENKLGVIFPKAFRRFLSEWGYFEYKSAESYGLGDGVPSHLDLVRNALAERNQFHPHIPPHLVPFMPNGCGDHYCIDTSVARDDPPVVFWDHELDVNQKPLILAKTFSSWLNDRTND